jgi:hypothetical protein
MRNGHFFSKIGVKGQISKPEKNKQFFFLDLTFNPDFRKKVTISHSYEQNFPMLPIILFSTIYNLTVCSLGTLNPSEQFSICSAIT